MNEIKKLENKIENKLKATVYVLFKHVGVLITINFASQINLSCFKNSLILLLASKIKIRKWLFCRAPQSPNPPLTPTKSLSHSDLFSLSPFISAWVSEFKIIRSGFWSDKCIQTCYLYYHRSSWTLQSLPPLFLSFYCTMTHYSLRYILCERPCMVHLVIIL